MLLASVWWRLLAAGIAVAGLWAAVLWVAPSTPSISSAEPAIRVAAPPTLLPTPASGGLQAVVRSGFPAPGGGRFDRFDVAAQPIAAPVNARGQVPFYATVLHSPAREGIFIAEGGQVRKLAAFGDNLSGGGSLAEFGAHPLPALNAAGHVAFVAQIAGGRATERSEEHTSELQSPYVISYAVFCFEKKNRTLHAGHRTRSRHGWIVSRNSQTA